MPYRTNLTTIIICLAFLLGAVPAAADPPTSGDGNDFYDPTAAASTGQYAPGQVVVGFESRSAGEAACSHSALESIEASMTTSNVFLFQLAQGENPETVSDELEQLAGATFAHPNYLLNELHPVQGSLAFSDQVASGDFDDQPAAQLLNLSSAHQVVTGDQVTVGILDGGVDCAHPGLDGQAIDGYDFIDNDAFAMDEPGGTSSGHGTFVAGVVHLVAPDAALRAYRVMDADGRGDGFTLARAIEWAALDNCDVINLSVVLTHQHLAVKVAIEQAIGRGAIVIGAAGNEHTDMPVYPAAEAAAVAVAAVDDSLRVTEFTNYGYHIDVCAPGLDIYSTYQGDLFAWWSGTSFSTPFVSGQAALLRQRAPRATVADLRQMIVTSAFSVDHLNPEFSGWLGSGLVGIAGSVEDQCCETPGDVNGNGLIYESIDEEALTHAIATGDPTYLAPCIGNADLNGDCLIDAGDLLLLRYAIIGDTMPVLSCGPCTEFELIPDLPKQNACCELPGDLNGNQIAFEIDDLNLIDSALSTGDLAVLGDCVGNADVTGDCTIDNKDAFRMIGVIMGDSTPIVDCLPCETYAFIPDTIPAVTAWTSPISQSFETDWGVDSTTPGIVYLASSGDPMPYTATVTSDPGVIRLTSTSGMTNEDVLFDVVSTADLDSGLYIDTIVFEVDGAVNSPVISVVYLAVDCCQGQALARAWPYAQAFGAPPDVPHTQTGSVLITSTNAPAAYTVSVLGTADFTQLTVTEGVTDDTLEFVVTTGDGLPAGVYTDTLAFDVEGTAYSPTLALLFLEVREKTGPDSGMVHTLPGAFYAASGKESTLTGNLVVTATGLPKDFTVAHGDEPEFLTLLGSGGTTGEPIAFEVTVTADMTPGHYADTVIADIDSCFNSPILSVISLYIDTLDVEPTGDSAFSYALPGSFFDAPHGEDQTLNGSLVVAATGGPKSFTVTKLNPGGFVDLYETAGTTDAEIAFDVVSSAAMPPGIYVDSLHIEVADVINSPLLSVIFLNIDADSVVTGDDNVTISADHLTFEAPFGSTDTLEAYIHVQATNSPVNFTVYSLLQQEGFVFIPDSISVTPDSVLIRVVPEGWEVGVHEERLIVAVDGFYKSDTLVTILTIVDGEGTSPTDLTLANHPNPFNPETEIEYSLPTASDVTLKVYNILGREVVTLVNEFQPAGQYAVLWDGKDEWGYRVASGVYLYRLQANSLTATRKMLLLK